MHREIWPTLFEIALDYLPIQASSVASERVFSSSAETDTKKRNRISPPLFEALQMLKYAYKADRNELSPPVIATTEAEMTKLTPDFDILHHGDPVRNLTMEAALDLMIQQDELYQGVE
jgi:hypothetical protein